MATEPPTVSPTAVLLVMLGYFLRTPSLDEIQRIVREIIIPLYACIVTGYIVLRIYHVVIEPRLIPSKPCPPLSLLTLDEKAAISAPQPIDLTGKYKLVENDNFEGILAAQGVPWALRSAANRARPTHKITHKGNLLTIKIEGIIETETTYHIGGPPTDTIVRGRSFQDHVTYLEDQTGIQTMKRAVNDGYTIRVCRRLASDKSSLVMTSTVYFDDENKEIVDCKQLFERVSE